MADEESKVEEEGGKSKLPLFAGIAVAALVIGGGGGFAAASFLGGEEPDPVEDDAMAALDEDAPPPTDRTVHAMEPFMVNLRGGGGGRMLRLEIHLEVATSAVERIQARDAVLRDAVLALASDQTYADLEGLDGKTYLRDELLRRLNAVLEGARVERVYFTDFVVQ